MHNEEIYPIILSITLAVISLRGSLSFPYIFSIHVSVSRSLAHRIRVWPEVHSKYWRLHQWYTRTVRCGFYDSRTRSRVKLMAVDQLGLNQGCVIGVRIAHSAQFDLLPFSSPSSCRAGDRVRSLRFSLSLAPGPFHPAELVRVIRNALDCGTRENRAERR